MRNNVHLVLADALFNIVNKEHIHDRMVLVQIP